MIISSIAIINSWLMKGLWLFVRTHDSCVSFFKYVLEWGRKNTSILFERVFFSQVLSVFITPPISQYTLCSLVELLLWIIVDLWKVCGCVITLSFLKQVCNKWAFSWCIIMCRVQRMILDSEMWNNCLVYYVACHDSLCTFCSPE